jgi:hypothetical protein
MWFTERVNVRILQYILFSREKWNYLWSNVRIRISINISSSLLSNNRIRNREVYIKEKEEVMDNSINLL